MLVREKVQWLLKSHSVLEWYSNANSISICRWLIHWRNEWNVLFNDTLNTFYLRWDGAEHMVKVHSVRRETRHYMGYSPISINGSFVCTRIAHTTVIAVVIHRLEQGIARGSTMRDRSNDPSPHELTCYHGATSRSIYPLRHWDQTFNCIRPRGFYGAESKASYFIW